MKPSELANSLRRIASAIDNSKSPDRTLVARDLKRILAGISSDPPSEPGMSESDRFDGKYVMFIVKLNDAVYSVTGSDIHEIEESTDHLKKFYELAKHIGHPDKFDEQIDIEIFPRGTPSSTYTGWEDLFGHAKDLA